MISYHKTVLTLLSLTAAWAPYFDDMDAIIFLAPIRWVFQVAHSKDSPPLSPYLFSCFDQVLEEDNRVNRLVSISTFHCLSDRSLSYCRKTHTSYGQ